MVCRQRRKQRFKETLSSFKSLLSVPLENCKDICTAFFHFLQTPFKGMTALAMEFAGPCQVWFMNKPPGLAMNYKLSQTAYFWFLPRSDWLSVINEHCD